MWIDRKRRAKITEPPNNPNFDLDPDDPPSVYSIVIFDSRGPGVWLEAAGSRLRRHVGEHGEYETVYNYK